jgi:hypothetical protein
MPEIFDEELDEHLSQFDKKQQCKYCETEIENKFCNSECQKAFFND